MDLEPSSLQESSAVETLIFRSRKAQKLDAKDRITCVFQGKASREFIIFCTELKAPKKSKNVEKKKKHVPLEKSS